MPPDPAPSEFAAFGQPVPMVRRSAALDALREMVPGIELEQAMALIDPMVNAIERDDPYRALQAATGQAWDVQPDTPDHRHEAPPLRLDVTGGYRLLAHLCTDPTTVPVS